MSDVCGKWIWNAFTFRKKNYIGCTYIDDDNMVTIIPVSYFHTGATCYIVWWSFLYKKNTNIILKIYTVYIMIRVKEKDDWIKKWVSYGTPFETAFPFLLEICQEKRGLVILFPKKANSFRVNFQFNVFK